MIREGQVVLFQFPFADQKQGKLRPAIVIRQLPGAYEDWLICMISAQLFQEVFSFGKIIAEEDRDFSSFGLKLASTLSYKLY